MKRITKKYLAYAQAIAFASVLTAVLLLNLWPSGGDKQYDWARIRYRSKASSLPEARGICPGLEDGSKPALVVARVESEDTKWLDQLASYYHLCVYTADAPLDRTSRSLQIPANRGHEAMAYLTFMIDNYENIPEAGAVFVHGSRFAWHNDSPDYDNEALLKALNLSSALQHDGYTNLRCDWSAGTCSPLQAQPQGSLETLLSSKLQPWSRRAVSDAALPKALQLLFDGSTEGDKSQALLRRSDAVRAQCCAQFAVSREAIWRHSRDEYSALRQWLLDDGVAPSDDRIAGRILSYVWHMLFLASPDSHTSLQALNAQACPSAQACYCRLYGKCDLQNCDSPRRCRGQYVLPRDYRLPADWEELHSGLR
ncbi:hypothetical protein CB0940_04376 [Cercospora beticola]|uniref:Uncharacterized protein n=1 Tax=Cercospora beticola TaxID=122368 RepID=A0A2G5HMA3_CERBT|nr:hypothetical protein CB0940_04376 [Cercospora beticola]PIA93686.1 hypothetical protein CB0940_04376 [Cercospora beticola]WPB01613.1 hypothetical protein RHO25_006242 [Cercospora beticola]CAK1363588.1 unnamed protein product [Cercospora beticola]